MLNGKMKALTFSFDDGGIQDRRFIELLDKYGLKCTFNLNSGLFGSSWSEDYNGRRIDRSRVLAEEVGKLYKNHEVAGHTLTHPFLPKLSDEEIISQVEEDRKRLEELIGKPVLGMAYPGGGKNCDERVCQVIKNGTKMKYARGVFFTDSFDMPADLYNLQPSVDVENIKQLFALGKEFLELKPDTPKVYNILGHSYELDRKDIWEPVEEFFALMSGKDDIFYGTYGEIFLR
jgi:peptidoglycan/xylan/chitin deacetylase (PgdA/CDA1 family)